MNNKLMSNFSDWLKTNREKSDLTLIQLRDKIGGLCSDAYLSKLENNRYKNKKGNPTMPALEIVDALATALNRPIDEARLAAGYAPTKTEETRAVNTALRFDRLPQTEKERLSKLLEFLDAEIEKIEKREKNM